ncbi:hypothetical protein DRP07_06255 [Archaeoglobales archaeon]|nr:MAG: hypothetical protein DRP07_06255 [Archaeoglobales archaeon]
MSRVKEELKDYRCRVVIKAKGKDRRVDVDAKMIPVKDVVGKSKGMFFIDFKGLRIEFGQDLLDDLFEEIIWFVSHERVRKAIKEYFERC